MSWWNQLVSRTRRAHHQLTRHTWRNGLSYTWLLTISNVVSLLYLFYILVLPHLLKFRFRSELSWYDLGLYGFGPTQTYVSFEYESPVVQVSQWRSGCDPRFTFLAPRGDSISHPGPMILDAAGNLVWIKYNQDVTQDFKVQRYQDEDYLTYWEGKEVEGRGQGSWFMLDSSYTQHYEIHPVGAFDGGDLHEFLVTEEGTALITVYDPVPADLTDVGGPVLGWLYDGLFQEIDIETGELMFEWRASNHFPLNVTYDTLTTQGYGRETAFDYFHINSIDKDQEGNYLVSARHAHSVSYIDGRTGAVLWTLGGKMNDFTDLSNGTATDFAWQHDARWIDNNHTLTMFDNGAHSNRDPETSSRGVRIHVDPVARTAKLQVAYHHPQALKSTSQGNVQTLEDTGNVFVEWGHSAAYTEFTPDGHVLCDVHFGASAYYTFGRVVSYRASKGSWTGRPLTIPDAAVVDNRVYVSWNGATEVAAWRLQMWDGRDLEGQSFATVLQVDKYGFETAIEIPDDTDDGWLLRVVALDAQGAVLGMTTPLQRLPRFSIENFFTVQHCALGMAFFVAGSGLLLGLYRCCCCRFRRPCRLQSGEYHLVAMSDNGSDQPV